VFVFTQSKKLVKIPLLLPEKMFTTTLFLNITIFLESNKRIIKCKCIKLLLPVVKEKNVKFPEDKALVPLKATNLVGKK